MSSPIRLASAGKRLHRFIAPSLICALAALGLLSYRWAAQAMCMYKGTDNEGSYFWTCVNYGDNDGWPYDGGGGDPADSKQAKINQAVADAKAILQRGGKCATFFQDGYADMDGVLRAVDDLGEKLTPGTLSSSENDAGIKQSGAQSTVTYTPDGTQYRLFASAVVNNNGPFFSAFYPGTSTVRPRIGSTSGYTAGTRQAQVLMVLHEIAHLIKRADGSS